MPYPVQFMSLSPLLLIFEFSCIMESVGLKFGCGTYTSHLRQHTSFLPLAINKTSQYHYLYNSSTKIHLARENNTVQGAVCPNFTVAQCQRLRLVLSWLPDHDKQDCTCQQLPVLAVSCHKRGIHHHNFREQIKYGLLIENC